MLVGVVAAMAHGMSLPVLMLFFGNLLDSFIYQGISSDFAQAVSNQTGVAINCSSVFNYTLGNFTYVNTNVTALLQSQLQSDSLGGVECLLNDEFISEVNITVFIFVGIAVAVLIVSAIEICTFQFASERQVYRIRLYYYRAVMRQDIAWFDENPAGAFVSRLNE